jgi:signal transduction histidine kinase
LRVLPGAEGQDRERSGALHFLIPEDSPLDAELAWLYKELDERERALQNLAKRLLGAQEEERRRVAYEVHDGLAQVAVAAHQNLQAFARRYAPETEQGKRELDRILGQVRSTVSDARRLSRT